MFFHWMNGQTDGPFVQLPWSLRDLFVLDSVRGYNFPSLCCQMYLQFSFRIYLPWMDGTPSFALNEQDVSACSSVLDFGDRVAIWFVVDIHDHYIFAVHYLCGTDGLWPWTNRKYVCIVLFGSEVDRIKMSLDFDRALIFTFTYLYNRSIWTLVLPWMNSWYVNLVLLNLKSKFKLEFAAIRWNNFILMCTQKLLNVLLAQEEPVVRLCFHVCPWRCCSWLTAGKLKCSPHVFDVMSYCNDGDYSGFMLTNEWNRAVGQIGGKRIAVSLYSVKL